MLVYMCIDLCIFIFTPLGFSCCTFFKTCLRCATRVGKQTCDPFRLWIVGYMGASGLVPTAVPKEEAAKICKTWEANKLLANIRYPTSFEGSPWVFNPNQGLGSSPNMQSLVKVSFEKQECFVLDHSLTEVTWWVNKWQWIRWSAIAHIQRTEHINICFFHNCQTPTIWSLGFLTPNPATLAPWNSAWTGGHTSSASWGKPEMCSSMTCRSCHLHEQSQASAVCLKG